MTINPYASVKNLFGTAPAWLVDPEDQDRIRAYEMYESIYWNVPDTFKLVQRGEDEDTLHIYLPSARKMIEATNRFLAVDWDFMISPRLGSAGDQQILGTLMLNLFKRELIYSKFSTQRRYGLIKGDAMWHITADSRKPAGTRISVHELDPGQYFPIVDENNFDRILGCHIVDLMDDPRDPAKQVVRRQTYRKDDDGIITSSLGAFDIAKWDDRNLEPGDIEQINWEGTVEEFRLQGITTIPVYHIKNNRIPSMIFGSSEIRGIESVIAGVNQAISDEDLALAMAGLGVYWTTAGPPEDEAGNPTAMEIGPARMLEVGEDQTVGRLGGVTSVAPSIDHMKFMLEESQTAIGVPDIAAGKVDVTVAESGISLRLQLAPLLAKNAEKEQEMLGTYDHLLYDLSTQWFPNYEGIDAGTRAQAVTVVGDPLPTNRQAEINEIIQLISTQPPLITIPMAQARLAKLGYEFPDNAADEVVSQAARLAKALAFDPYANRFAQELENAGNNGSSGAS